MQALDFGEGGLEAVELGFVLGAAFRLGDGVLKGAIVVPELEFFEGWTTGEKLGRLLAR